MKIHVVWSSVESPCADLMIFCFILYDPRLRNIIIKHVDGVFRNTNVNFGGSSANNRRAEGFRFWKTRKRLRVDRSSRISTSVLRSRRFSMVSEKNRFVISVTTADRDFATVLPPTREWGENVNLFRSIRRISLFRPPIRPTPVTVAYNAIFIGRLFILFYYRTPRGALAHVSPGWVQLIPETLCTRLK